MILVMVPHNGAFAVEPDEFVTSAKANHWGRSDLRAWINNATKTSNTLPIDTSSCGNSANFPSYFSTAEYKAVQPFTYETNVLDDSAEATAIYETTDRFWLPSGSVASNQVISWSAEDISSNSNYDRAKESKLNSFIPISYWSQGSGGYFWLRSPFYYGESIVLGAYRGYFASNSLVRLNNAAAVAFKIDLSSVSFSSAASAASFAAEGGAKKIEINGSSDFGKKTSANLPDYGMYLKTEAENSVSFTPESLVLKGTNLEVSYTGGVADQYIVVHAFKEDDLNNNTASYVAVKKLTATGNGSTETAPIDVTNWGLNSLDGYTIKVWMEDSSGSLAKATTPVTFYGTSEGISDSGTESKNTRVFAMKDELQTSWGTLANATNLVGTNPTNQKIYFGSKDGKPLEFWIAGRETAANGGEISENGNIMTLYQAKSVDTKEFNDSVYDYTVDGKSAVTLTLDNNQTDLDSIKSSVTFIQNGSDLGTNGLNWLYRKAGTTAWSKNMPTVAGKYEIRCYAEGNDDYERTYSAAVEFESTKSTPTANDFTLNTLTNLTYDGEPKEVTFNKPEGMGNITVKYYKEDGSTPADGTDATTAPKDAGTYKVKIDVAEGNLYYSANDLTDTNWTFTINKATPSYTQGSKLKATYGQKLSDLGDLSTLLDKPTGINDAKLDGTWEWSDPNKLVGDAGDQIHAAQFTPSDTTNYDWSQLGKFNNGKVNRNIDVYVSALPLDVSSVKLSSSSFTYNGSEQKPTVTIKNGSTTLTEGTDYGITWSADVTNAGTKDIKINFKNNYSGEVDTSYTITPASITPYIKVGDKVYDGSADATVEKVDFNGLQNGEALEEGTDYTISASFEDANAGENKIVTATIMLKESEKAKNYTLSTNSPTSTATISKKEITVKADNQTKIEGENDPELTYTTEGLINGDTLTGSLERDKGETPGVYVINQGTLNNPNYDIKFTQGTFTTLDKVAKEKASQQENKPEKNLSKKLVNTGDKFTYLKISGLGLIMTLSLGLMLNPKINRKKYD